MPNPIRATSEPSQAEIESCQADAMAYVTEALARDSSWCNLAAPSTPVEPDARAIIELIGGLMAKNARLAARLEELTRRVERLATRHNPDMVPTLR